MAKPRRLKVYRTTAGFYEVVVAAPNQAEALKAWGIRQNLFAEGAADVVEDAEVVKAANAAPGQPLRRPIGAKGAYEQDPTALPAVPETPRKKAEATPAGTEAKAAKLEPPPKPDRKPLDAAEKRLKALDDAFAAKKADIDRRRQTLDDEQIEAEDDWRVKRKAAVKARETAARAYRQAGGEP
jgi:hypothetical protein